MRVNAWLLRRSLLLASAMTLAPTAHADKLTLARQLVAEIASRLPAA